jgi:hypothetical protein
MTRVKKSFSTVCAIVSLLLQQGLVQAQSPPTISSTTGSITTGSLVTINGSNLENESKANWDPFFVSNPTAWSFEGSNPVADGYSKIGPDGGTYDSNVTILGNHSIRFHAQGASSNCPIGNLGEYNAIDPPNRNAADLWIRLYARWSLNSGNWPGSHIKMIDSLGPNAAYEFYFNPANDINGNLPFAFQASYQSVSHLANIPSGQLQNNRWYVTEMHWKTTEPQLFAAWIDGTLVHNGTTTGTNGLDYILFGLINLCGTNSAFNLDHWIDGFTIASSRIYPSAMVEVGNSPNYVTATKNVQALETISDNRIVFKANLTNLGSGPYYVWVRNNPQAISSAFALAGGTPQPPPAPVNLRIVR